MFYVIMFYRARMGGDFRELSGTKLLGSLVGVNPLFEHPVSMAYLASF